MSKAVRAFVSFPHNRRPQDANLTAANANAGSRPRAARERRCSRIVSKFFACRDSGRCLKWVIRVGLTLSPLLPVYPNERTSRDRPGWSVLCHRQTMGVSKKKSASGSGLGSSGKVAPHINSSRGPTSSKTLFALLLGFFRTLILASATI